MAPSPEDDNTPKAPDKSDKNKCDKVITDEVLKEKDKEEKTLSNLNDGELKALLDEAITYKNPKDREGKSKLFKDLLIQAEETERIARATSAGGSELVRHCNPSARRNAAVGSQRHHQGRRKSSRRMASETVMHGGSLDNLAQEELFLESAHNLMMTDKPNKRTAVSTRQREGGSLPCDVNSSLSLGTSHQFYEEAKRKKAMKDTADYSGTELETFETQRLLDHDSLAQNYEAESELTLVPRFTTRATLQISATPVDDPIPLDLDSGADKKIYDVEALHNKVSHSKYSVFIPTYNRTPEEKKLDENGNPIHQSNHKTKKKKKENVVTLNAESVEGHRSDIINDVDKLMQFIGGDEDTISSSKAKSNVHHHKSKQLKQHVVEDAQRNKKQRAHSSKGKENRGELKKSNSLNEISTTKLDNFEFDTEKEENKVVLRTGKNSQSERPKERRSWGNVEPPTFQVLSSNASTENLETTENWVVTKPKKKSKKRRNSISSGGRRQNSSSESTKQPTNRVPSPDLRGNTTRSVPHSEKSDSSDVDSVHSLPIDDLNMPISYADIAKNSEKLKEKKTSPEKVDKTPTTKDKSPNLKPDQEPKMHQIPKKAPNPEKNLPIEKSVHTSSKLPPDVNNIKNFPAISPDSARHMSVISPTSKQPDQDAFPKNCTETKLQDDAQPQTPKAAVTVAISATDAVIIPKNTISESSHQQVPKVVQETVANVKTLPPDVHNYRSFPAMPNANKNLNVSEKTANNTKNNANNKNRNISPGNNNNNGGNNYSKNAKTGNNNNAKISARNASNTVHNDIQNDLTILHSNEKESIQFNAQMLPPDIPDVRTIEKMHFMNLTPPSSGALLNANQNHQQQHRGSQNSNMRNNSPSITSSNSSLSSTTTTAPVSQLSPDTLSTSATASLIAIPHNKSLNNKQTVNTNNNNNSFNINNIENYVNCDNTSDRTVIVSELVMDKGQQQQQQQQPQRQKDNDHPHRHHQQQHNVVVDDGGEEDEDGPPPVVILSGFGNKEVPGLVFGFDINEQLLNEDICENFISRYIEPDVYKNSTHNHEKIVNFIGSAWEAIVAQSDGKVQYYREES